MARINIRSVLFVVLVVAMCILTANTSSAHIHYRAELLQDTISVDTAQVADSTIVDDSRQGKRRIKRRAKREEADSAKTKALAGIDKVVFLVDSLRTAGITVDSLTIDSLARHYFSDTLRVSGGVMPKVNANGSLSSARILDSLIYAERLNLGKKKDKPERVNIFRDTLPFGRMSTLSIVFPGFGQIYNKQQWKLPILYTSVAALTYTGIKLGDRATEYKGAFNSAVADGRQADIDANYAKYRDYRTASTILYASAGLTYMYFLADGAFNYKGEEDSKNRATFLAFMFPGAGQIYNKQYWKLPIVYGGFATFAYVINFNNRGYVRFKAAYDAVTNDLPDEFGGAYSADVLRNTKNNYRRARDMSLFYTFGFYLFTVVDAYVSASFKQYDISDDLSMRVSPTVNMMNLGSGGNRTVGSSYGMSLSINF